MSSRRKQVERARPLLGTRVAIRVAGLTQADANRMIDAGFAEIATVHRLMSFHEHASDISRLNRGACDRAVAVHPHTFEVIRHALELAAASQGVFDITVAGKLVEWGFLPAPDARRKPDKRASWRDIELVGGDRIRFHRPLWIDLGGIAKGYAVDRAVDLISATPEVQCRVNAGGDLRVCGSKAERVLLRVAAADGTVPVVEIENGSLASSTGAGQLRRYGRRSVGPHVHGTRRETMGAKSFVSVVAERCIMADALTKVVLAKGARAGRMLRHYGATAYMYTARTGWRVFGDEAGGEA